ncbi:MAG: hypothetical protein HZC40_01265 [Chloroflexi bacterium]|nr:hypothetical protein [Chloroflexota bacterium]
MTQIEILQELKILSPMQRLKFIEAALEMLGQDLQRATTFQSQRVERKRALAMAANALLADYSSDVELTVFTSLDGEDVHA